MNVPAGNLDAAQGLHIGEQALERDAAGHPWSARYGDRYSSADGALGQARHVFLAGNGLPERWAGRRQFVIVELGFGLGGNFLATWAAWRADPQRPQCLHVVSVERHPLRAQDIAGDGGADDLAPMRRELALQWPMPLPGLHRLEFEGGRVVLTLALGDARRIVPGLSLGADAFYLDGFSPERNPEMWEPALLRALARLARPGATAASYTCARAVRDALKAQGFEVERAPGFGSKREMLRARYAPRWRARRYEPPAAYEGARDAIIVGAGLAGCSCALALRRRGWKVTLVDRAPGLAAGASALPAGLLQPLLSVDDNLASQLSRSGFLFSRAMLQRMGGVVNNDAIGHAIAGFPGGLWAPCGVFHQASSAADAEQHHRLIAAQQCPEAFASYRGADDAAIELGMTPHRGGTWFGLGAVVSAEKWCRAMIDAGADAAGSVSLLFGRSVQRIERYGSTWRAWTDLAHCIEAPVLILANAIDASLLPQMQHLPLRSVGGRLSLLAPPALETLRAAISGAGYIVPPLLGQAAVGASYEENAPANADSHLTTDESLETTDREEQRALRGNALRLPSLLRDAPAVRTARLFHAQRCVARDRMPLAGAVADDTAARDAGNRMRGADPRDLPRHAGLYCLTALGSRGLTLAPLLGETLAASINGEPAPIDAALSAAVDPGRFVLRGWR